MIVVWKRFLIWNWLHHINDKYDSHNISPQLARVTPGPDNSAVRASPNLQHVARHSPLRTLHCVSFVCQVYINLSSNVPLNQPSLVYIWS